MTMALPANLKKKWPGWCHRVRHNRGSRLIVGPKIVCLISNCAFTETVLRKTCLRAARERTDKEACGPAGRSLPLHRHRGKHQQGRGFRTTCCPNTWSLLLQTQRGWRFPLKHAHTHTGSTVDKCELWCICLLEANKCATKLFHL